MRVSAGYPVGGNAKGDSKRSSHTRCLINAGPLALARAGHNQARHLVDTQPFAHVAKLRIRRRHIELHHVYRFSAQTPKPDLAMARLHKREVQHGKT